ncbi:MAG: ABC transporter ATP-binding protein [Bacteroidales bacterium]|nr:ABC transporter ATP-binding protein [Bacteroidales bacterium]MBN2820577.1 ABC transporter ATP-binding protein [Bacteroidales bacterium]
MIKVEHLSYTYREQKTPAVNDISFEVKEGEIFGFLGPSGAGKSTTQKILIKIFNDYTGDVQIMNKPLNQWGNDFYEKVGVGFELPNHYAKLTAAENLRFFASFYRSKTIAPEKLLKMVGLEEDASKKVESFSKGMKMRLNFVRALMHNPDILFLDEPTSGLDPANGRRLKDIILEQKAKGKTIFLTTHNMYDADELCDRVSFIIDGKLSITDTPHSLKLINGQRKVNLEYGVNGNTRFIEFNMDGIGDNKEFLNILKRERIASIHSLDATLDEIFIKITGKTL